MIRALKPAGASAPEICRDPVILEGYREDASGAPPGRAQGLSRPQTEAEAAATLRWTAEQGLPVLFQAARSSLTGGAVPRGEVVVSVERLNRIGALRRAAGGARIDVEPGVRLLELQTHLAGRGFYYPPVPTYQQAMLGGTVSTNAGGAATFKYGVTRDWIRGLRVLLSNGDLLVLERGQALVRPPGCFRIRLSDGTELNLPAPDYRLPRLKKISAGYHAADPLDLVDLFIGSEGTLGLITSITVDVVPLPASVITGLVFLPGWQQALRLATRIREQALRARVDRDPLGPDVRAIESMDAGCLGLLRRHGEGRRLRIDIPDRAGAALIFEMELSHGTTDEQAQQALAEFLEPAGSPADQPLTRLFRVLDDSGALDTLQLAFPEDPARRQSLTALREAVPERVGEIIAARSRAAPGLQKVGGDLIVPFDRLGEMVEIYEHGFRTRGLDFAVWGHVSDGNLHPNALARDAREVQLGFEALLEFADEAVRRGGCPLSEHGVGRHPVKQQLLRRFLGEPAVACMRRIKRAIDPEMRLAPGVLFPVN